MRTVAALYVSPSGPYPSMPDVECWDEKRNALLYDGPHPVVAHPPCARWCRLAKFVEKTYGHSVGDDGGTFAAALASVRKWGGVLGHPAFSLAWRAHGLIDPSPRGGWQKTFDGEWVCSLAQSAYGHVATKGTWLLACGVTPPKTDWRRPKGEFSIGSYTRRKDGTVDRKDARRVREKSLAIHSTVTFAEYLVSMARSAQRASSQDTP